MVNRMGAYFEAARQPASEIVGPAIHKAKCRLMAIMFKDAICVHESRGDERGGWSFCGYQHRSRLRVDIPIAIIEVDEHGSWRILFSGLEPIDELARASDRIVTADCHQLSSKRRWIHG